MVVQMKREDSVSRKITQYIKNNQISVIQVANDTGIPKEKIESEELSFNATEFLEICSYLHIRPEDMK